MLFMKKGLIHIELIKWLSRLLSVGGDENNGEKRERRWIH
jgi:hypothetical protein